MSKPTPENSVKKEVKKWLQLNGWFVFPILQGLGAYKGISDFIAVKNGDVLFIECKAPKGTQSENQIKFQADIEEHGGYYILARGYEDVEEYIESM